MVGGAGDGVADAPGGFPVRLARLDLRDARLRERRGHARLQRVLKGTLARLLRRGPEISITGEGG